MQTASLVTEADLLAVGVHGGRVNVEGGPKRVSQRKEPGAPERAGSFEKGRPPVVAGYSLCEPVSVCLSLFTSLSQIVVAAAPVKTLQPIPPGKSRVSRRH